MRRPAFLDEADESWLRRIGLAPLVPLAWLYAGVAAWRRRRIPARRLACRVVSVGNLGVGGAGKTPVAAWVAAGLRRRGHRVVLASRGYGRRGSGRVRVVSDGRRVLGSAAEMGDEPMLLAAHAPGVPVLVGPHRDVVGYRAIAAFGAEVLVLDDGFQHHRLARDVDVVTVSSGGGFGNRRVLPRGPLRESPRALAHADAIGAVDAALSEADEALIARRAPDAFRFEVTRPPAALRPLAGGASEDLAWLRGRPVGMLCGIARPASFRATLEALGARVIEERCFADHHIFRERDLAGLGQAPRGAAVWITTEKDAVKLLPRWADEFDLRVLTLATRVSDADAFLDWLETRLIPRAGGRSAKL